MTAGEDASAEAMRRYSVGDELRVQREAMGKSIADIVDAVRIQSRYLEALEDGRLDDLPGTVYALGFVRTYAEYLGLDAPEIVARYKEETEGLKTQSYVMPEPLEEGKVPTAAILLVAVLLAAAAYGGWYFLSRPDGGVAVQEVPEVPERLAAVTEAPAPVTVPPASTPPAVDSPSLDEGDAPPPAVEAAPASTPSAPALAPTPPAAEATSAAPVQAAVTPPPEPVQPDVVPAPVTAAPEAPAVAQPPAAPEADAPVAAAEETPSAPAVDAEPREPRVYGLGNVNARIIIIAEEDAWVEVTDSDNARLFSRVLRKGDSYRAPNREGAKFVTGNAGGLKIMVDGEEAPALGPPGQVRREVKLDPGLLKAGQAWP